MDNQQTDQQNNQQTKTKRHPWLALAGGVAVIVIIELFQALTR